MSEKNACFWYLYIFAPESMHSSQRPVDMCNYTWPFSCMCCNRVRVFCCTLPCAHANLHSVVSVVVLGIMLLLSSIIFSAIQKTMPLAPAAAMATMKITCNCWQQYICTCIHMYVITTSARLQQLLIHTFSYLFVYMYTDKI